MGGILGGLQEAWYARGGQVVQRDELAMGLFENAFPRGLNRLRKNSEWIAKRKTLGRLCDFVIVPRESAGLYARTSAGLKTGATLSG
jgi:hypothetical protein